VGAPPGYDITQNLGPLLPEAIRGSQSRRLRAGIENTLVSVLSGYSTPTLKRHKVWL
jgi:hypothetical protein